MNPALLAAIIAANTKQPPEQEPEPEQVQPAQESEEDGGL
ncbi:hypothetical protein P9607_gp11 [Escherichia phage TheodorHerzl]|uniref:Uncharacterized protein n=2 Tax=Dhillonvirus TaxID=1623289 RepID=A0A076YQM0_9CAUD|nr:hypothetical protein LD29_gp12 [Escherichia phage EK99P-1]YP_010740938.1 hypothetical protein P9607_gp11 [Escherichia phage TheodorHerzl]AIK68724.1 hypothetical protein EK99P-1_0012 [Escherichia phage EK99P-1]QXV85018.1 hypothetical protein bas14_0011 [Escherichia phage TheodorHerzl]